eukprot:TRINITY_DN1046_c0_g1_i1.p1 TRINITY_DN1046_c0_g1~~TRINITY_DN1046_c0_g1_i1.p1  ORF type:complete len:273 (-),score=57.27 TRINITY_DN1046_c0_g1_i1:70-888(-)
MSLKHTGLHAQATDYIPPRELNKIIGNFDSKAATCRDPPKDRLVQCHVHPPVLYQNKKIEIRLHYVILSWNPLIIISKPGLNHLAYSDYRHASWSDKNIHVANNENAPERNHVSGPSFEKFLVEQGRVREGWYDRTLLPILHDMSLSFFQGVKARSLRDLEAHKIEENGEFKFWFVGVDFYMQDFEKVDDYYDTDENYDPESQIKFYFKEANEPPSVAKEGDLVVDLVDTVSRFSVLKKKQGVLVNTQRMFDLNEGWQWVIDETTKKVKEDL